jgi:hypothetical protein
MILSWSFVRLFCLISFINENITKSKLAAARLANPFTPVSLINQQLFDH